MTYLFYDPDERDDGPWQNNGGQISSIHGGRVFIDEEQLGILQQVMAPGFQAVGSAFKEVQASMMRGWGKTSSTPLEDIQRAAQRYR